MLIILFEYAVCLLAIYGLFAIIRGLAGKLRCRAAGKRPAVRLILLVKDAEEQIEYIIRNTACKGLNAAVLSDRKIAVIDMGSADNTRALLEKLEEDFQNIDVYKFEDRLKAFEGI